MTRNPAGQPQVHDSVIRELPDSFLWMLAPARLLDLGAKRKFWYAKADLD